jgi:hypothetical protein
MVSSLSVSLKLRTGGCRERLNLTGLKADVYYEAYILDERIAMPPSNLQAVRAEEVVPTNDRQTGIKERLSLFALLKNYALAGAVSFLALSLLEQLDLNLRLTMGLASVSQRIVLFAYSGLNVLVGVIVGLVIGGAVFLFSAIKRLVEKALPPIKLLRQLHSPFAALFVAALSAILLKEIPRVNAFILGLIREIEKLHVLRNTLLNHERAASYLMLMAIVTVCALLIHIVGASGRMHRYLRLGWVAALSAAILLVYYFDSRVEVQLYEFTMHRWLYFAGVILAMSLVGTLLWQASPINSWWQGRSISVRRSISVGAISLLLASTAFTFWHFGRDQQLKTHIFYRSTQAKQNFKLARWALDRDRDGYAALLDGGDADDSTAEINPGVTEVPGDGVDNNGLGGDLATQDVEAWRNLHHSLRPALPQASRRYNVVYFFIDTVRADHMSAYGYHRKTTPNLDRLAERGVLFENGFSPAARTAEAIPRFMQSSYWDARIASWPEVLTRSGYQTMLFPGRRSWDRYGKMMRVVPGGQGKALKENIDFVIERLGKTSPEQPFCAYVYVPDPHLPYIRHAEFDFGSSIIDLYDGELAYTDFHVGRLLDWMEQSGRFQDTMIVVMSDHGESLGERGVYRHATQLYNEQTRVPMLVYLPGVGARRVSDYVSTIDLGSTILSANGLDSPKEYLGVSLLPLMRGEAFSRPPVYGEQTGEEISPHVQFHQQIHPETKKYMAIAQDGFKMIFNRDVFSFELYDLKTDPKEERNLYGVMPEKAIEMRRLVLQYVDIVTASRPWNADEGRYSKATGADGDKVED